MWCYYFVFVIFERLSRCSVNRTHLLFHLNIVRRVIRVFSLTTGKQTTVFGFVTLSPIVTRTVVIIADVLSCYIADTFSFFRLDLVHVGGVEISLDSVPKSETARRARIRFSNLDYRD